MKNDKKNKTAFLAYSFSDKNAGDFALTLAAINLLITNSFDVIILSRFTKKTKEFAETKEYYHKRYGSKVKMIEAPFTLKRDANALLSLINYIKAFFVFIGIGKDAYVRQAIKDSDVVIIGGGNLLRGNTFADYIRLYALYYPVKLAGKNKKQHIILPQSSGKISFSGKFILSKLIRRSKMVFMREKHSYKKLKSMFPEANITDTFDLAFFLQKKEFYMPPKAAKKKIVLNCRADGIGGIRELSARKKGKVEEEFLKIINQFKHEAEFTFVVQGTKLDREFTDSLKNKVLSEINLDISIIENHDPLQLIDLYEQFDLIIGMRLHAIILAVCGGTPGYGLFFEEWGLKNPGIFDSLDLPYTMLDGDKQLNNADFNIISALLSSNKSVFHKKIKEKNEIKSKKFNKLFDSLICNMYD